MRAFVKQLTADSKPSSRPFPLAEAILWALAGGTMAGFLLWSQAAALGSTSSLLQVGVDSDLAPFVSGLFTDLHLVPGVGTDGQTYFAIANDLKGDFAPSLMASPGLRYARIGFPWLASLGGSISGAAVLYGMLTVITLSAAAASSLTMGFAAYFGMTRKVAFGLFGNLGWFLGIRVLTPDPMALALMLGGMLSAVHGRHKTSYVLFVCAVLTKEPYYAGAVAVAIWLWQQRQRIRAAATVVLPAVAGAAATAYTNAQIGSFADAPNVSWPAVGIFKASSYWLHAQPKDVFYSWLAIAAIVLAVAGGFATKHLLVRWSAWGWAAIGLLGSDWIWFFGNSTARVLAPAWLFAIMCLASTRRSSDQASESFDSLVDLDQRGYGVG
ncbi:MAG: hypothetical protein OEM40_04910, partial [Acidimicrobiia bacterium]|nr:hypothetical protein [Acidimicrobiia bacterium]